MRRRLGWLEEFKSFFVYDGPKGQMAGSRASMII